MVDVDSDATQKMIFLMKGFAAQEISAAEFVTEYQRLWRLWRELDRPSNSERAVAEIFDKTFTASDCFTPEKDQMTSWSIHENELRAEVSENIRSLMRIF